MPRNITKYAEMLKHSPKGEGVNPIPHVTIHQIFYEEKEKGY